MDYLPSFLVSDKPGSVHIDLDRSTLAAWVGRAASVELKPVYDALLANMQRKS